MTRFWRDGYWRYRNGNEHWVTGHFVERDDWSRSGYSNYLSDARVGDSLSSRYVNPNADCPVCGQRVFFYRNEFGSRVYFDELGPPWPKHPCTDSGFIEKNYRVQNSEPAEPEMRSEYDVWTITNELYSEGIDLESRFRDRYRSRPWTPVTIVWKFSIGKKAAVIFEGYNPDSFRELYSVASIPRSVKAGSILSVSKKKASFIDPTSLNPRQFDIERVKRLDAFLALF